MRLFVVLADKGVSKKVLCSDSSRSGRSTSSKVEFSETVDQDIIAFVFDRAVAGFDLLDVTKVGGERAFSKGEDGIGDLGDIDRSLQVAFGQRHVRTPFGRVCDDQDRDKVGLFQLLKAVHKPKRNACVRGRALT